jgi:hypothetical protein
MEKTRCTEDRVLNPAAAARCVPRSWTRTTMACWNARSSRPGCGSFRPSWRSWRSGGSGSEACSPSRASSPSARRTASSSMRWRSAAAVHFKRASNQLCCPRQMKAALSPRHGVSSLYFWPPRRPPAPLRQEAKFVQAGAEFVGTPPRRRAAERPPERPALDSDGDGTLTEAEPRPSRCGPAETVSVAQAIFCIRTRCD